MHDDLLDDWPEQEGSRPKTPPTDVPRHNPGPDPIGMLFTGIPEPVIVNDEEDLPIQRPFSAQLIVELVGWLLGVTALIYAVYRLCQYFGWWGL